MEIDFNRAALLLHVVTEVAKNGPAFGHLQAAAMAELREMNDKANPNRPEPRALRATDPAPIFPEGGGPKAVPTNTARPQPDGEPPAEPTEPVVRKI